MNPRLGFTLQTDNSIVCIEIDNLLAVGFTLVYLMNKYRMISAKLVVCLGNGRTYFQPGIGI